MRRVNLKPSFKEVDERIGTAGQMKPLTIREVRLIKDFLGNSSKLKDVRDLALFSVAIDSMLRSVDLLKLRVADLVDRDGNMQHQIQLIQKKTGKPHIVELQESTLKAVAIWIEADGKSYEDFLWTGFTRNKRQPITRMTYGTILKKDWIERILQKDSKGYNSHSLRRTKASIVYERTQNVEIIRQLLGQSSTAATSAYLNLGKQDALNVARQVCEL